MEPTPLALALAATAGGVVAAVLLWLPTSRTRKRLETALSNTEGERQRLSDACVQLEAKTTQLEQQVSTLRDGKADLQAELSATKARADERERGFQEQLKQLEANRKVLRAEFENLSREFLSARDRELRENNKESIGAILKPLADKIEGFQTRVNQVHGDMVRNSASLTEQIRSLEKLGMTMSEDATNLTRALKGDKKLVGNWGEAQLERTLELAGLTKGEHFEAQASYRDEAGAKHVPDFVIKLPEGKNIVVDSKVSLVDYEAAVAADDDEQRSAALGRHVAAVKAHIDGLSAKDYAQLPGMASPDFVLMFMPVEPAYIEVMKHHRDLFAYGYQKGVVMVSHTTLMPILRTVSNLWMMERSNAEAREISDRAGDIFNSVCLVAERLQGLGTSLQTVTKKYNDTVTAIVGRQGLHGKVERFQSLSHKATRSFPDALNPMSPDTDAHQLGIVTETALVSDATSDPASDPASEPASNPASGPATDSKDDEIA